MLLASIVLALSVAAGPVQISGPDQIAGATEPQAAVDDAGGIFVTFGAGDKIYVSHSNDKGASFTQAIAVASPAKMMLGNRRGPRIAATNGNVVLNAISNGNIYSWAWESADQMWSTAPAQINDSTGSADEGLTAMAASSSLIACVWLDHRDKCTDLYISTSQDGGQNWGANTLVYKAPTGSICECCDPSVVIAGDGAIHVMFRNSLDGNRDMYVCDSTDDGETWTAPKMMGTGHWKLDTCPMDGGAIGVDGDGNVTTLWRRDDTVYSAQPDAGEKKIGIGLQPWLYGGQGKYGVYLKRAGGPLMTFKGSEEAHVLAADAIDPMVAGPAGGNGPVVAVWATSKGEIMAQVLAR